MKTHKVDRGASLCVAVAERGLDSKHNQKHVDDHTLEQCQRQQSVV
jgi:hypothetical protein